MPLVAFSLTTKCSWQALCWNRFALSTSSKLMLLQPEFVLSTFRRPKRYS